MLVSVKELIIAWLICIAIFRLARPIALQYMALEDFSRRRNVWVVLTAAAFLSPNFWIFAIVAAPVLINVGRKDPNPAALYLFLLHVIPPIAAMVPLLFPVDLYTLLSIFVMLPAALRMRRSKQHIARRGFQVMDFLLVSYGLLTAFLYLHPEISRGVLSEFTFTYAIRRILTFVLVTYIPYFVISRSILSRSMLLEALAAFCLACLAMAGVAIFESASHWLLFGELAERWGQGSSFSLYYWRGASLRAAASAGHPLVLGYLIEIAFGFWLCLQSNFTTRQKIGGVLLLWLGLLSSYSRGPWLGACCIFFVFYALRPRVLSGLFKAVGVAAIAAIIISFTPLGDKIAQMIPGFSGSQTDTSVDYRQRFFNRAWLVVQQSPFLGDQDALLKLQDMRQGEGIIDVINTYINVLLGDGFFGLSLFLGFILIGAFKSWSLTRRFATSDTQFSMIGAALVACIVGTLLMMVDGSFGGGLERMFYTLTALAAAYSRLGSSVKQDRPAPRHTQSDGARSLA